MLIARVAELVDALDLGSSGAIRGGSSPPLRTKHRVPTLDLRRYGSAPLRRIAGSAGAASSAAISSGHAPADCQLDLHGEWLCRRYLHPEGFPEGVEIQGAPGSVAAEGDLIAGDAIGACFRTASRKISQGATVRIPVSPSLTVHDSRPEGPRLIAPPPNKASMTSPRTLFLGR